MGITAWDFTGNPTSAVLKNGYDPFSVGSLWLLPTCRCVFLSHEQRKCSLVAGREAEGLKKHLSTSCWFDQRRSPTHWRGDKHQARSGLTLIGFDVVSGGKKIFSWRKLNRRLYMCWVIRHMWPPLCLVSMDTSLEIFPRLPPDCLECRRQTASEGLGSGEAQAERRPQMRKQTRKQKLTSSLEGAVWKV